jgi:hypothetical protein
VPQFLKGQLSTTNELAIIFKSTRINKHNQQRIINQQILATNRKASKEREVYALEFLPVKRSEAPTSTKRGQPT